MPHDPMGKGRVSEGGGSLTEEDFENVAKKWEMGVEEVKRNTYDLLKKEFEQKG